MLELIPRIVSYCFVILIYIFIMRIIQMVHLDISLVTRSNSKRKKGAYIKLINQRHKLDFIVKESYDITKTTIIGRGHKCHISIDDPFLSTENTKLLVNKEGCFIEDLKSTNGTYLNGSKISGSPIELRSGDQIVFGQLKWLFVGKEQFQ